MSWISVNERMPPKSEEFSYGCTERSVLVLATDGKDITTAYHMVYTDGDSFPRWIEFGRDGYEFDGVTHWMPLPELP